MRRRGFWICLSIAAAQYSLPAAAQEVATAATLFEKGVADMAGSQFEVACPEIAESYRLDPRPGTLFTLAECYAKDGKTASAVARYQNYLDLFARLTPEQQGKQQGREKTAQAQKERLSPDVPMLTLKLPKAAPPNTEVKRDGNLLGGPSVGLSLPVDPGEHTITSQAPGGPVSTQTITIQKGEKKEITLTIVLSTEPRTLPPAAGSPSGHGTATPLASDDGSHGGRQRAAGWIVGSVGVAGLIVGAITGGITLGKKSTITNHCNSETKTCKDAAGLDAVRSAHTTGLVSTVSFVAGGVLAATGVVVVLTAPKRFAPPAAPRLGLDVGLGRLGVSGTF